VLDENLEKVKKVFLLMKR